MNSSNLIDVTKTAALTMILMSALTGSVQAFGGYVGGRLGTLEKAVGTELRRGRDTVREGVGNLVPRQHVDQRTTRVNWTVFNYGNGSFIQENGGWTEYQNGRFWARFQELGRNGHSIKLYDPNRNMTIFLYGSQCYFQIGSGPVSSLLYNGRAR